MTTAAVAEFWAARRADNPGLPAELPEVWAFGATPDHADELLALVLEGIKTGTASSLWDYEHAGEKVPEVGDLSIILDGAGEPRAVLETTAIEIVPFDQVDAEHAAAEGEGDRTLAHWRAVHERYWREHSDSPRGYEPDMPVICERFRVLFPRAFGPAQGPVPAELRTPRLLLRPLLEADAPRDFEAVVATREGLLLWEQTGWPEEDFTVEGNREDLRGLEERHRREIAYTFTVADPSDTECLGCVYLFPTSAAFLARSEVTAQADLAWEDVDAVIYFWTTGARPDEGLDARLLEHLRAWFAQEWGWATVAFVTAERWAAQADLLRGSGLTQAFRIVEPDKEGPYLGFV
ncbi:ASCH domain-containing protein [Demequina sp.]|uniref:ASCH domain-containing protein n=1 Tax=Demequina sp. TaxID=2050685 RepID=UPI003A877D11